MNYYYPETTCGPGIGGDGGFRERERERESAGSTWFVLYPMTPLFHPCPLSSCVHYYKSQSLIID